MADYLIICDGGALHNQTPEKREAYGSYVIKAGRKTEGPHRRTFGRATSNQAEYAILICALEHVLKYSKPQHTVSILMDADLAVNQINGDWKVKNPVLARAHAKVMSQLEQFKSWTVKWQPRTESVKVLGH